MPPTAGARPSGSPPSCAGPASSTSRSRETGGHPVVYADWLHAEAAPTVLVYGHYDVQPVDPLEEWESPPFEPLVADGRIFARGAADDKSHVRSLLPAAEAAAGDARARCRSTSARLRGRGGVELGQPRRVAGGEPRAPRRRRRRHQRHGFFDGNLPAITIGLRGLIYAQIDVDGPQQDLHSGGFGGAVEQPGQRARGIIAGAQGAGRPDPRPRLLRRRGRPHRGRTAPRSPRCPSTRRRTGRRSASPALVGENGFTTLERRACPADPRRERDLGRLPGRGLQDDHPGQRARQGQLPARAGPGSRARSSSSSGSRCCASPRPASGSRSRTSAAAARASRRSITPPRGRSPGPSRRSSAGAALRPRGRLDPGRRDLRDHRSACRSPSSASCPPTATPTPPTSGWASTTSRPGSGAIARFWTSSPPAG